jgi:hypothetical protein
MYHHLGPCHVRPSPNRLQTAWGHCGGAVAVCHNCQGAKNASGIYQATRVINLTKFDIHENLGKPIQRNPTNWGTFWLVGKIRGILSKSRQSRFVTICHAFSDKCYNFKRESFNCVTICHDLSRFWFFRYSRWKAIRLLPPRNFCLLFGDSTVRDTIFKCHIMAMQLGILLKCHIMATQLGKVWGPSVWKS